MVRILTRLVTRINVYVLVACRFLQVVSTSDAIINHGSRFVPFSNSALRGFRHTQVLRPKTYRTTVNHFTLNRFTSRLIFNANIKRRVSGIRCRRVRLIVGRKEGSVRRFIIVLQVVCLVMKRHVFLARPLSLHLSGQYFVRIFPFLTILIRPGFQGRLFSLRKRRPKRSQITNVLYNNQGSTMMRTFIRHVMFNGRVFCFTPLIRARVVSRSRRCLVPIIRRQRCFLFGRVQTRRQASFEVLGPIRMVLFSGFARYIIYFLFLRTRRINRQGLTIFRFSFPVSRLLMCLRPIVNYR